MGCCGTSETKENTSPNRIIKSFSKENCQNITSSLPTRTNTDLQSLKDEMKSKTKNLSQTEKSYVAFLWECQNIDYDAQGYFSGSNVDCTPEGVFKNGKTVCSGYSRLYKELATYLELTVECIPCYSKGVGYEPGKKLTSTDHEYNAINLNNKWFPLDATWGAGHIEGSTYIKAFNDFYFLANPELLIKSHFPADDKWQLTKKKYTLEEFMSWPKVYSNFYQYGFYKYSPENGCIVLKNKNTQKFIVWRKDMKKAGASCNVYLLQGNCYNQQLKLSYTNYYEDRFEVDCIFNKKGKYKVQLFGNDTGDKTTTSIMDYTVIVENDAKQELSFPQTYNETKNINLIEPLYDNLKSGEKVSFKIKSDLDTVIIIDGKWYYLEKKDNGLFEKEITIQTEPGKNVVIGKKKGDNSCDFMVSYNVI